VKRRLSWEAPASPPSAFGVPPKALEPLDEFTHYAHSHGFFACELAQNWSKPLLRVHILQGTPHIVVFLLYFGPMIWFYLALGCI
jgi:hypothetical protein